MCKFVNNTKHSRIDKCMIKLVKFLSEHMSDYPCVACCCGHGRYPMTIVVDVRKTYLTKPKYVEIVSGIEILRKRNFYVKDKKGDYYLPESIKKI